jgi:hypothetical protein
VFQQYYKLDSKSRALGARLLDPVKVSSESIIFLTSATTVNSWACQWDSRVSCSQTKAPRSGLSNPGLSQGLSARESEGLVRCPLTSGLADGQPVPPTTSGPVGRIFIFEPKSNHCGFTHNDNRHAGQFECQSCGKSNHADYNAAKNVTELYLRRGHQPSGRRSVSQYALKSGARTPS